MIKKTGMVLLLGMLCLAAYAEEKIIPYAKRMALLNLIDRYTLQYKDRYPAGFRDIVSPFTGKSGGAVVSESSASALSETDILNAIAPLIKPTGSIARGEKYVLVFQHEMVRDGGTIQVKFRNKQYLIYVTNITETEYTLRLGGVSLKRNFE